MQTVVGGGDERVGLEAEVEPRSDVSGYLGVDVLVVNSERAVERFGQLVHAEPFALVSVYRVRLGQAELGILSQLGIEHARSAAFDRPRDVQYGVAVEFELFRPFFIELDALVVGAFAAHRAEHRDEIVVINAVFLEPVLHLVVAAIAVLGEVARDGEYVRAGHAAAF